MNSNEIYPYTASEFRQALDRFISNPELISAISQLSFHFLAPFAAPFVKYRLRNEFRNVYNVADFQEKIKDFMDCIIRKTTDGFTCSGIENIVKDSGKGFLLISNHRDVALDAALANYVLHTNGHNTAHIAFADSFLVSPVVSEFFRLNKGFVVKRDIAGKNKVEESKRLSEYIVGLVHSGSSVWIAQRSGRAKDGNDFTNPALLSMLYLSQKDRIPFNDFIAGLNMLPVSISYEYDPCDSLKAKELVERETNKAYKKSDDEDKSSLIRGITGCKGRIHLSFGTKLTSQFQNSEEAASELDRQIIGNYHLWPTNYAAYDVLNPDKKTNKYTAEQRMLFCGRVCKNPEELQIPILKMYANPVVNKKRLE